MYPTYGNVPAASNVPFFFDRLYTPVSRTSRTTITHRRNGTVTIDVEYPPLSPPPAANGYLQGFGGGAYSPLSSSADQRSPPLVAGMNGRFAGYIEPSQLHDSPSFYALPRMVENAHSPPPRRARQQQQQLPGVAIFGSQAHGKEFDAPSRGEQQQAAARVPSGPSVYAMDQKKDRSTSTSEKMNPEERAAVEASKNRIKAILESWHARSPAFASANGNSAAHQHQQEKEASPRDPPNFVPRKRRARGDNEDVIDLD